VEALTFVDHEPVADLDTGRSVPKPGLFHDSPGNRKSPLFSASAECLTNRRSHERSEIAPTTQPTNTSTLLLTSSSRKSTITTSPHPRSGQRHRSSTRRKKTQIHKRISPSQEEIVQTTRNPLSIGEKHHESTVIRPKTNILQNCVSHQRLDSIVNDDSFWHSKEQERVYSEHLVRCRPSS